jgi:hypothetical protein
VEEWKDGPVTPIYIPAFGLTHSPILPIFHPSTQSGAERRYVPMAFAIFPRIRMACSMREDQG